MDLRPYYILIGLLLGLLLPYLPRSISYIYSRCRRNDANELYAPTDSLLLNLEEPKTRWMNMGYWRRTESFPEACEALATMIGDRARIPEEGTILVRPSTINSTRSIADLLMYGTGRRLRMW